MNINCFLPVTGLMAHEGIITMTTKHENMNKVPSLFTRNDFG
jgi:hypothetical protein